MAGRIRVLDSANRTMQRVGFLKALAALVNESETSNLETLGKRFIARVTQRTKLVPPYDDELKEYARTRLTDGAYRELRKKIMEDAGPAGVELQDVYLADKSLPSSTGKLVQADWRRYPYLATSLEIVKKGTYSGLTRSLVLLAVTPKEELAAFGNLDRQNNPMRISECQAIVLLYCFLDNDAAVALPLLRALIGSGERFDERFAGDLLPEILREVIASHAKRSLPVEEKRSTLDARQDRDQRRKVERQGIYGKWRTGRGRPGSAGTLLRSWSAPEAEPRKIRIRAERFREGTH